MTWRQVCVFHTRGGRSPDPSDCPSPAAGVRRPGWPRATAAAFLLAPLAGFRGRGGSDGKHVLTVYLLVVRCAWFFFLQTQSQCGKCRTKRIFARVLKNPLWDKGGARTTPLPEGSEHSFNIAHVTIK